ncbi:hypothetical protein CRENBAI_004108, partial [Crenichthys baileyi]
EMFALPPCQFSRPTRPPTDSQEEEVGRKKRFLPGWSWSMWVTVGAGRQGEKNRRRKARLVLEFSTCNLTDRVKLLSLVRLKQVDASSSPLQIRQTLVS